LVREHLLLALLESPEDGILTVSLDGTIETWSRGAEHIYGYTAQEMTGQPLKRLVPIHELPSLESVFSKARENDLRCFETTERLHKDGSRIFLRIERIPIRDELGEARGILETGRTLNSSSAHPLTEGPLRLIIEQMPGLHWTTDQNLQITSHWGKGLASSEISSDALVGHSVCEFLECADRHTTPIAEHCEALRGSPSHFEYHWKNDLDTNCATPNSFAGLLVSKTDARGIRTCSQYDALNREIVRNFSNGDATITTTYDQPNCLGLPACQDIGHRTSMTDAAGSEAWSYQVDVTNNRSVAKNQRTTSGITKTTTYILDNAGNTTQATYPTGRVVNYTYDSADRPSTAVDGSNGITYANDFQTPPTGCLAGKVCYTPQGTFYALSIGQTSSFTGLNLTHSYNSRLQPIEFKASSTGGNAIDITYTFVDPVSGKNAGHVYGITNNLDTTRSQTFSYDQLNRISSALTSSTHATSPTHCWGETYSVDAWGNLQSIVATTNSNYTGCSQESGFTKTADGNNHLSGFSYDLSGNTQSDGVNSYAWDGESQLKSAGGVNYLYDGDGRRVSKSSGKLYWYGSGGEILAETDASGNTTAEYIFFGGKRVAMLPASSTPIYYVEDLLGTSRVTTTNTGVVCYDADFYPYGGERPYTNTCPQNYKFEGKERDVETGNDDFGARYYSNRFGRWLSADWSSVPVAVPYANLANPQTLNLYAMVADDPESFADLDGHEDVALGQHTDDEIKKRKNEIKQELKNKDLTKEQKDALNKEKNTLNLEQQGNHVVGNMLANLNKVDPGNGLKLSDFTLSTDTKNDFAGKLSEKDLNSALGSQAFVLPQRYGELSQTIYIRTEPSTGFYQMSQRSPDFVYFGASVLAHEGAHRFSHFDERNAFYVQDLVMHEFKNYFQNAGTYRGLDGWIHNCMQSSENCSH
jgi:PAS domain S-box-containing protein/RHS repeat-associated protein